MQEVFAILGEVNVGVWHFPTQQFIPFVPCPGEKRVRIDVFDGLENYAVYAGEWVGNTFYPSGKKGQISKPLEDWRIDLT
jgi:hypothetical protein